MTSDEISEHTDFVLFLSKGPFSNACSPGVSGIYSVLLRSFV